MQPVRGKSGHQHSWPLQVLVRRVKHFAPLEERHYESILTKQNQNHYKRIYRLHLSREQVSALRRQFLQVTERVGRKNLFAAVAAAVSADVRRRADLE